MGVTVKEIDDRKTDFILPKINDTNFKLREQF